MPLNEEIIADLLSERRILHMYLTELSKIGNMTIKLRMVDESLSLDTELKNALSEGITKKLVRIDEVLNINSRFNPKNAENQC